MRRADIASSGIIFALGLVTIFVIIPKFVAGSAIGGDLSPAFMPYVAATIMTVTAGILCLVRIYGDGGDAEPAVFPRESWYFIACSVVIFVIAFVLMDTLGYLAGAAVIVAGFMTLARTEVKVVVLSTVAFPLTLWLLFDKLLNFPLP